MCKMSDWEAQPEGISALCCVWAADLYGQELLHRFWAADLVGDAVVLWFDVFICQLHELRT